MVLSQLFKKHVIPTKADTDVKLILYYKPKKLSSCFSLRTRKSDASNHGLVYQFSCQEDGCNASYVGYTMNSLKTRAQQHRYKPSKIHAHFINEHNRKPTIILDSFSILYKNSSRRHTRIAEAVLIKEKMPFINVKYNEMSAILKVFK